MIAITPSTQREHAEAVQVASAGISYHTLHNVIPLPIAL